MGDAETISGLVSVVIPVFNRPEMLLEAVSYVAAQTHTPIELILVDDGSTDETGRLCDRLATERPGRVRAFHQRNAGPGAAREAGRRVARGEFIQYLDSDDFIEPGKLEAQVAVLRNAPDAGVCYCITRERLEDGSDLGRPSLRTGERLESIFPVFLSGRIWQTVTPLWRRGASDAIGEWTSLRIEEDMEYDARAGGIGIKPVWCPELLAEHRHHRGHRASFGGPKETEKLRCRADAHERIYRHAVSAGVPDQDSNMQRFARELFLLSRQCGAAGLSEPSRRLFQLAKQASGPDRSRGLDFQLYQAAAILIGWDRLGDLSCRLDSFRGAKQGTGA